MRRRDLLRGAAVAAAPRIGRPRRPQDEAAGWVFGLASRRRWTLAPHAGATIAEGVEVSALFEAGGGPAVRRQRWPRITVSVRGLADARPPHEIEFLDSARTAVPADGRTGARRRQRCGVPAHRGPPGLRVGRRARCAWSSRRRRGGTSRGRWSSSGRGGGLRRASISNARRESHREAGRHDRACRTLAFLGAEVLSHVHARDRPPLDEGTRPVVALFRRFRLVAEVLSPNSRRGDRVLKRRLYQQHGVETYWIVDPARRLVEVWHPGDVEPQVVADVLAWRVTPEAPEVHIALEEIFRQVG